MNWKTAAQELPAEGQPVILQFPTYAIQRPWLARLEKGDPDAEGLYYQQDKWLVVGFVGESFAPIPVSGSHLWAPIDPPEGVEWS